MPELLGHNDFLTWARDESTSLDFNIFPNYAVITVKFDPTLVWLVRDGEPLSDRLLIAILGAFFMENYKPPIPEAA